jgi:hypothetical protein
LHNRAAYTLIVRRILYRWWILLVEARKNTIVIPDKCRDVYFFEDIIALQDLLYRNSIKNIDLSSIAFIEPYSMVCLLLLGRNYLRNTGERLTLVNIPLVLYQYLSRMDFFKSGVFSVSDSMKAGSEYRRSAFSNRVIEVTEIPGKERESIRAISAIISLFRKRADHILKYWINDTIVDYFVTVISEVCQNIFEHSMDSGYCAMQTYSTGGEHIVRLVIADSGIGIKESFALNPALYSEAPAKLIELALTTPLSSKRRYGYGLCQVRTIVEKLGGSIFIRSGEGSLAVMYNKKRSSRRYVFVKNDLPVFPGTQISISLFS